MDEINQELSKY